MSIVLGSMTTGAALHGSIKPGAWAYSRVTQTFFGVVGEQNLIGEKHSRDLTAWVLPSGYATHLLLHDGIETVNGYIGTSGSMVCTIGADIKTFTNCIFEGFETEEDPWLDGSGVNGWMVRGIMKFRQIKS